MCQMLLAQYSITAPSWECPTRLERDMKVQERWWELPKMGYRPQYLELKYRLQEQQPSDEVRRAELLLMRLDRPIGR